MGAVRKSTHFYAPFTRARPFAVPLLLRGAACAYVCILAGACRAARVVVRGAAPRAGERPATGAVTANHLGLLAGRAAVHPERDLVQRSPSGTLGVLLLLLLLLLLMRDATPNSVRLPTF